MRRLKVAQVHIVSNVRQTYCCCSRSLRNKSWLTESVLAMNLNQYMIALTSRSCSNTRTWHFITITRSLTVHIGELFSCVLYMVKMKRFDGYECQSEGRQSILVSVRVAWIEYQNNAAKVSILLLKSLSVSLYFRDRVSWTLFYPFYCLMKYERNLVESRLSNRFMKPSLIFSSSSKMVCLS